MSNENSTDDDASGPTDQVRTSVEVDRHLWRQVRAEAVGEGKNVSEKLEEILEVYFGDDSQ
ncbi:hypothetical protein DJ71_21325 [Halorubrum sp. E3]|nr:hypothetical protein DJ71_21325 [Halorubrum sp. E3]